MPLSNLPALQRKYSLALETDVIPFWMKHSPDRQYGGYFTCLERGGEIFDTDKFVWLQCRQVWMFSKLFNTLRPEAAWLEMARLGAEFLRRHGHDENGDWYFSLDRQGRPLIQPYNVFSDCFAAMAFAEYGRASKQSWATDLAVQTFERIRQRWDNPKGKYSKAVPGSRPMRSLALPMITVNLAMELGAAVSGYDVNGVVDENLDTIMKLFVDPAGVIHEHVSPDGSHPDTMDGRLVNPGHGIECMWFIIYAAGQRGHHAMVQQAADALLRQLEFGWDREYGGIFYFLDVKGHPPQQLEWDQKLWWVHVEALIATLMAWQKTGRQEFADWYARLHAYTWSHFPDPEHGEWYGYLNRRGEVLLPLKGGKWKGCFHVPRGMLWCAQILEQTIRAPFGSTLKT